MKHCVIKNTTRAITHGKNEDYLIQQALDTFDDLGGRYLTLEDIEILTDEEYQERVELRPTLPQEPTLEERLQVLETMELERILGGM